MFVKYLTLKEINSQWRTMVHEFNLVELEVGRPDGHGTKLGRLLRDDLAKVLYNARNVRTVS